LECVIRVLKGMKEGLSKLASNSIYLTEFLKELHTFLEDYGKITVNASLDMTRVELELKS
jgi:hypothetical protein